MKTLVVILFVLSFGTVTAQYYLYETKLTCQADKKEEVMQGHNIIKTIMADMVSEGRLLNFDQSHEVKKDQLTLTYVYPSINEETFFATSKEWKRRASLSKYSLPDSFWKHCPVRNDTLTNKAAVLYPYIKRDLGNLVAVVDGIDEKPDPTLEYNIVMDFTAYSKVTGTKSKMDSSVVNWALADIGRVFNLHIAAGIPPEKIHFVVAVHGGGAVRSLFNNEAYQKRYKCDNPNLPVLEELTKAGVKFLVCGQSMTWLEYKRDMLSPLVKVTLTAQTTLSSYQMKGYALKDMSND